MGLWPEDGTLAGDIDKLLKDGTLAGKMVGGPHPMDGPL